VIGESALTVAKKVDFAGAEPPKRQIEYRATSPMILRIAFFKILLKYDSALHTVPGFLGFLGKEG
jgi:hypothetical protein